jgi:hypothetical protein
MNTLFHFCICERQIAQSIGQYLTAIVRIFAKEFPYYEAIISWKDQKMQIGLAI